ncbi:MAG: HAD family hydrolase [Nanoarchaeota archaeon]|nr:HAD family hydrolase [Nanoarchaeota archaeon]
MERAIFLDRDGIINKNAAEQEYITSWREFEFLPNVLECLARAARMNYKIFVITNQRGIARGKMSEEDVEEIHSNMINQINDAGGRIDKIYVCPHGYGVCDCRKPLPGMLDMAKQEFNISLEASWVIGDAISDIEMGKSRKYKTICVGKGAGIADYNVKSLREAIEIIISDS